MSLFMYCNGSCISLFGSLCIFDGIYVFCVLISLYFDCYWFINCSSYSCDYFVDFIWI